MSRWISLFLLLLFSLAPSADARAVPPGVPYTGHLVDGGGAPFSGLTDVEATAFATADSGAPIWGPIVFAAVTVEGGRFEVVLDAVDAPLADALQGLDSAYFAFRIRPQGQDWIALEGRQRLGSVGFAYQADNAERLGGVDAADFPTAAEMDGVYAKASGLASVAASGDYADLTGRPNLSGYALTNDLAGVCFSGSYDDLVDQPNLAVFVTTDALAIVATSGNYSDLINRPDLSVYALTADVAMVATTGQYTDLAGKPDLSVYATTSSLATVATTGDYLDLIGAPDPNAFVQRDGSKALIGDLDLDRHVVLNAALHPSPTAPANPSIGQGWFDTAKQSLMVYTDTGWQPVGGPVALPDDGLAAVSNGVLTNVFTSTVASDTLPLDIPDNYPPGVVASLTIDDSGTLRSLSVHVAITHPDASELLVVLTVPGGQQFALHDGGLGTTGGLDAVWPPTGLVTGDLASLRGISPSGTWTVSVIDGVYSGGAPGSVVGTVDAFEMTYDILRDGEAEVGGTLTVDGRDVGTEVATLRAALGELRQRIDESWCSANCGPLTFGNGCTEPLCDGIGHSCGPGNAKLDFAPCSEGACIAGECLPPCGQLGVPCPSSFACTPDGNCENPTTGEVRIPAGTFWMGCNSTLDAECNSDELAQHEVTLPTYTIDRQEVTAAEYKVCVEAGACSLPSTTGGDYGNYDVAIRQGHPINFVTWSQAAEYCAWDGKAPATQRLCTEAEWERAARGGCETIDGDCKTGMRKYPWGQVDPTCDYSNFRIDNGGYYCEPGGRTAHVGSHPAGDSPYGVQDMAGNVAEWVGDWYSSSYAADPVTAPLGPATGTARFARGGGGASFASSLRCSARPTGVGAPWIGFRCCRSW
ncbi:MAG: hypothetical protein EP329_25830 [Deltaproteobacteria bacterium]|nr:MAG: hypothetical protein EP329_25830 [Deltaproteobacteria bacterium]